MTALAPGRRRATRQGGSHPTEGKRFRARVARGFVAGGRSVHISGIAVSPIAHDA
ncbi:hypothetical protein [Burkholderia ubonensis]|uniref:hypothetical protein n=1 Tax=Burkholderia ubonensis TaxID=101571 RepID=UPI0012BB0290|nr:hypothetical protein [Burkholderia ubonensis]